MVPKSAKNRRRDSKNAHKNWDYPVRKYFRTVANRKVRRTAEVGDHKDYRKVFDLWWTIS